MLAYPAAAVKVFLTTPDPNVASFFHHYHAMVDRCRAFSPDVLWKSPQGCRVDDALSDKLAMDLGRLFLRVVQLRGSKDQSRGDREFVQIH